MYDSTLWPAPSADVYLDRAEKIAYKSKKDSKYFLITERLLNEKKYCLLHVELPT